MPPLPRIHNLRHNSSERTPARWLFFDTETWPEHTGAGEHHTLRLWCAELRERGQPRRKTPRACAWDGTTTAQLAAAVENACRGGERLWVCAHNLGFDLAVTALPLELVERGWELTDHALAGSSPWLRMRRRSAGLTFVDSWSWLSVPLDRLGMMVGTPKPPVDFDHVDHATLLARCRADTTILADAMTVALDWWEQNRLGHWSLTGPGTGFNGYRHSRMHTKVVIDPDPVQRTTERATIYGGRCEVWRVGELPRGLYAYVDFAHTFGSICATYSLPRKHGQRFDSLPLDHRVLRGRWTDVLAEVELETAQPRYPLRTAAGVVHPVGHFTTTLCGPEIREAHRRGELRAIGPGQFYLIAPHMADWASWALGLIDDRSGGTHDVVKVCVKGWTRTVPGRWAGRTSRVVERFEQPIPGWHLEHGHRSFTGDPVAILDMGGTRYWIAQDVEMDNGFPGVLAWIQSYVRVLLGRLIELIGESAMVLCNTDGLVIDLTALYWAHAGDRVGRDHTTDLLGLLHALLVSWSDLLAPLVPRIKWFTRDLEVLSPQHLITDHSRQLSGVPRSADDLGEHRYAFTDWPKLSTQLELDGDAGYHRRRHVVDLSRIPILRWVLEDGRTLPVAAAGALGAAPTLLAPWMQLNGHSAALRDRQHPLLAKVLRGEG